MSIASLVIAGAVAWCAQNPVEPLCVPLDPVPVVADIDYLRALSRDAQIRLRPGQRVGGPIAEQNRGDEWRIGSPDDRNNDCEDRVLWIGDKLRRERPDLYAGFRPVLVVLEVRGRVTSAHLVAVIETTDGPYMIDPLRSSEFGGYRGHAMYAPQSSIAGAWIKWPSQ